VTTPGEPSTSAIPSAAWAPPVPAPSAPWSPPGGIGPAERQRTNGFAVTALVLGLTAFCTMVTGVLAVHVARAAHDKEETLLVECDFDKIDFVRTHWPFLRDRRIDAYGDLTGFLYMWTWITVAKPASIATIAAGLARVLSTFSIFFRPGMAEEVLGAALAGEVTARDYA